MRGALLAALLLAACTVPESPEKVVPLNVGERIPAVSLRRVDGERFDLTAAVAEQSVVLVFYRGGW